MENFNIETLEVAGFASAVQALRLPNTIPIICEINGRVDYRVTDRRIGIYAIVIRNKFYIGSTSGAKGVSERLNQHRWKLKAGTHGNIYLQRAYDKSKEFYGFLIEETDLNNVIEREQYYIDTLNPHYNICREACNSAKGVKRRDTTKKLLSEAMMGRTFSAETLKLMSLSHTGYKMPESQKEKLRAANTGRKMSEKNILRLSKQVDMYSMQGEYIKSFKSGAAAARENGWNANPIQRCAVGKAISAYGYVWRYSGDSFSKFRTIKNDRYDIRGKEILIIDADGKTSRYNSINALTRTYGIDRSVVRGLLKSGRRYSGSINELKNCLFKNA